MKNKTLNQVSTLEIFENKGYDGLFPVEKLKNYGNTGFGTFHLLNGEMIILDGIVYRAVGDCSVERVNTSDMTPFATLGFLDEDEIIELKTYGDLKILEEELNDIFSQEDVFVLCRIDSHFKKMVIHGVWRVYKPYEELKKIVKNQEIIELENIKGTLVGVRCPKIAQGINVVGWHFHFITEDKKHGGHVNDLMIDKGTLRKGIKRNVLNIL